MSWYPPGDGDRQEIQPDNLMPLILEKAEKYKLKVSEPFSITAAYTGFPPALEIMENLENHEIKFHARKNHGIL